MFEKCIKCCYKLTKGLLWIWKVLQNIYKLPTKIIKVFRAEITYIHERTMKRYAKGFFKRIIDDFKYKELLSLKMVFFVHASTVFVLYPYLTIHMRELGINVEETAIMSALTPVVAILMPPVAGVIADRIGNFKILLALFSAFGGLAALLLLLVPVGRVTIPFPDQIVLAMQCAKDAGGSFSFTVAEGEQCLKIQSLASEVNSLEVAVATKPLDYTNINITLEACGLLCSLNEANKDPYATADIPSVLNQTTNYTIFVYDQTGSQNQPQTYDYNISGVDFNLPWILSSLTQDVRSFRMQRKAKNFLTSVQAFSAEKYFFPAPGLFNFTCNIQKNLEEVFNCSIKKFDKDDVGNFPYRKFTFTHISPIFSTEDADKIDGFSHGSSIDADSNARPNKVITNCYQQKWNTSLTANIADRRRIEFKECKPRCIMKTARRNICKNKYHTKEFDVNFTFWTYLTVRIMIGVIGGTAFAMFEGAVIAILREHNADYGLQHIYASIGGMISSPLSGFLIDYYSEGKGYTDFRPAFYFYGTLKLLSAVLMMTINLECKAPAKNVIKDVVRVLKKVEIIALFFTCFILGTAWGYIESFLFWVLQDLGATRSLMGITITVGGIAGVPLLVMSGPIIDHIGHANVLFIGFIFYAIRLVGYSIITAPWQCLIFEAMESITSSLAYTAAVTYAAKMSTTQTDSSVQGILGGLYFGVGKGSGSLSGGYLIKYFGSRNTFRIFSAITLTTGVGYFLFNKFYISKHSSDPEEEETRSNKSKRCSNGQIEIHDVSKRKSNGHLKQKDESNGEVNPAFEKTESDQNSKKNTHRRNSYNIEEFMETG